MGFYYLLIKNGKLYRTTSDVWFKWAKGFGYKDAGHACGKTLSLTTNGGCLSLTKEQKEQCKVEEGI